MKFYKKIILTTISVFAMSNVALAGEFTITGTAYQFTDESTTTTPDGNQWIEYTNEGVWVVEGMPEGFPSSVKVKCKGSYLMTPEWALLGDVFICTGIDADGDGFINVGTTTASDWSNCSYKRVASWGKWAGTTESGACWFAGNITSDLIITQFSGTFTTPE